jgi:hypothetical protein
MKQQEKKKKLILIIFELWLMFKIYILHNIFKETMWWNS